MRAIIVGYGRVGSRTARVLDEEGHEVTVIDAERERVERAEKLGFDVRHGDATDADQLVEAGIETVEGIAALTGDPNVNFEICEHGRAHDCRTVMRISEDFREDVYEQYEATVDAVIYPEQLGAVGAKTALLGGDFNAVADLTEQLQLTVVTVTPDAPIVGKHVTDLAPDGARVYAHGRERESLTIPMPGTEIHPGDRLAALVETDRLTDVRHELLGS